MKKFVLFFLSFSIVFLCSCTAKYNENNPDFTSLEKTTMQNNENEATTVKQFYTKPIQTDPNDPYSYIVKQICESTKKSWDGRDLNVPEFNESFEECIKLYYYMDVYYFMYDLDNDGSKELLLGSWMRIGNDIESENIQRKICLTNIYTIKNGKAVQVEGITWFDTEIIQARILYSNGLIVTKTGHDVDPGYFILGYENGKLVPKCYTIHGDDYRKIVDFDRFSEEIIISKREYKKLYNDFCGKAKVVDIDWKFIDEYGT